MTDYDAEFNMLVIKLGGLIKDFPIVKKFENQKNSTNSQVLEKHIEVDGTTDVIFTVTSTSLSKISDFKEKCANADAFLIFYDTASPQTVAIYDSFIKEIIRTKHKAVRVVGINPHTTKSSVRRKSIKSRSIASGWGAFHRTIQNKRDNEVEVRALYRDIATELIRDRGLLATKPKQKMIGGLCCFC